MYLLPLTMKLYIGGVFCCSVLALHLLWLATLHRRSRPTVLSGELDFAASLLGLGGFFAVGVAVCAHLGSAWAASRTASTVDETWSQVTHQQTASVFAVTTYGVVLATTATVGFWKRRNSLEIHNIEPSAVTQTVADAAADVGLSGSSAIGCLIRPGARHATVWVRRLDRAATTDLLRSLSNRLASAPAPSRSGDGRYTLAACGLLGVTLALFVAFFRFTRMI